MDDDALKMLINQAQRLADDLNAEMTKMEQDKLPKSATSTLQQAVEDFLSRIGYADWRDDINAIYADIPGISRFDLGTRQFHDLFAALQTSKKDSPRSPTDEEEAGRHG